MAPEEIEVITLESGAAFELVGVLFKALDAIDTDRHERFISEDADEYDARVLARRGTGEDVRTWTLILLNAIYGEGFGHIGAIK